MKENSPDKNSILFQIRHKESMLDRKEAAEFLGVKENTLAIWKCTKRYSLPYVKIGRYIRYRVSDLVKFIESNVNYD
jgi:predicted DNA-binding transcriptional regulator AlpA